MAPKVKAGFFGCCHTRCRQASRAPVVAPPAAYLAVPELRLTRLDQTHRRLDENRYAYAAPAFGYGAIPDVFCQPVSCFTIPAGSKRCPDPFA
ncbi:hypothetical protein [Mesorhizobium sp.]|uniref:hypothetical protein n=1 Tax=Mesorhizobium sp. TaxID=1871066 RepID=UPI000FE2D547|nr:hypothetical protein [Mesorhizobium sp.]RWH67880.1 MAG: hypothetical protein EOQ84_28340 [Mesorhizobium sp.]RWL24551.1 MAG: hypothetical protein EOR58_22255 [Mesorhizobium sp.]RWL26718.1 MAG: hypothetical protein EOR63_24865 [Mesorhizobium sp.]RWL36144.1 MAG: hypothetical protein EOR59_21425 [Mesorhizobium sp.]RWL49562.1 MAG: hypothetical protein EOR62_25195 [Mesorhizobium sp.]